MPYTNLQIGLTKEQRQNLIDKLNGIQDQMPYLVNLTDKEKKHHLRMGSKAPGFLAKSLDLALQNTHLLPPYFSLPDFKTDVQDRQYLSDILVQIEKLHQAVQHTVIALEQESMRAALGFYKHCQSASHSNVLGASEAITILKTMMPKTGKTKKIEE